MPMTAVEKVLASCSGRSELRAARVDAIGTATAEGHSLSKADMNGLLALRGAQDGGSPLPCAAVTVFRVLACK